MNIWNTLDNWITTWFSTNNKKVIIVLNKIEFSNNIYLNKITINNVNY